MNRPKIPKEFKAFTNLRVHSLYRFEFFGKFLESLDGLTDMLLNHEPDKLVGRVCPQRAVFVPGSPPVGAQGTAFPAFRFMGIRRSRRCRRQS